VVNVGFQGEIIRTYTLFAKPTFTTLFTKLFKAENKQLPHYLQSYLRQRTNNIVYALILFPE
jgi:hypothetical protein